MKNFDNDRDDKVAGKRQRLMQLCDPFREETLEMRRALGEYHFLINSLLVHRPMRNYPKPIADFAGMVLVEFPLARRFRIDPAQRFDSWLGYALQKSYGKKTAIFSEKAMDVAGSLWESDLNCDSLDLSGIYTNVPHIEGAVRYMTGMMGWTSDDLREAIEENPSWNFDGMRQGHCAEIEE